jgi:hypothetical protein
MSSESTTAEFRKEFLIVQYCEYIAVSLELDCHSRAGMSLYKIDHFLSNDNLLIALA